MGCIAFSCKTDLELTMLSDWDLGSVDEDTLAKLSRMKEKSPSIEEIFDRTTQWIKTTFEEMIYGVSRSDNISTNVTIF
jgi:hypothetical protein